GMLSKTILPEVKLKNKQKINTEKDAQQKTTNIKHITKNT
ncbi:hypothetical protein SAMN02745164_01968, partial [Marinitoga hydrogenitolerans DSM 16785]